MALTAITADLRQTLDIHRYFAPKITLNLELLVNKLTNAGNLTLRQILDPSVGIHIRLS